MSTRTAVPTVKKAKSPTILHDIVRLRNTPVRIIHVHHGRVKSLRESRCEYSILAGTGRDELVAELVESNVAVEGHGHEEDEGSIQQDELCLKDVSVICVEQFSTALLRGEDETHRSGQDSPRGFRR